MLTKSVLLFGILLCGLTALAQESNPQQRLDQLAREAELEQAQAESRVQAYLATHNVPRGFISQEGVSYYMEDIASDGKPVYIITHNLAAAATMGVNELRSGGSLGTNLTGQNMSIGIWEVFGVLQDHVEFENRLRTEDAASEIDNHATHVTGTVIAAGINPSAQGMAYQGRGLLFTASNDVSEMTSRAKPDQTSLLLSNHSYGVSTGWAFRNGNWVWNGNSNISDQEDYRFGFYDNKARSVDQLAFNAPYYLIVKSAGNDRNDTGDGTRPPDGPYDAISSWGNAKNILTVGAVNKIGAGYSDPGDVVMSAFSSWGPTDDGRIKPDVVAPGVNLLSSIGESVTSYGQLSGTSMAAPSATGALALIQQLAKNRTNNFLRAATLKALIAHTAHPATTNPGPDYRHGWGLLNAEGMAAHILQEDDISRFMDERTLANGNSYEQELMPQAGTPIRVTVAWTDPAGSVSEASVDPTDLKLVNDLDVRLVDEAGNEYLPWILDPAAPGRNAQRGDNFRDNIEQVVLTNPEPRKYTLRITHKNSLSGGNQNYSLIISYTPKATDNRTTYYYIGGDGEWGNGSNWSLTSGGAPANTVPGPEDRVVVDENSFSGTSQFLSLGADQSAWSFTWLTKQENGIKLNGNTLSTGSFLVSSSQLSVPEGGIIRINGSEGFNVDSNALPEVIFEFASPGMQWNLTGKSLVFGGIHLMQGNLNLTNTVLDLGELSTSATGGKILNLSGSDVVNLGTISLKGSNLQLVTDNASFSYREGTTVFEGNNRVIRATITSQNGSLNWTGQGNRVYRVNLGGTASFSENNEIDSLQISEGTTFMIGATKVLTINDWIDISSSSASPVEILSEGGDAASMSFTGNRKFCFGNLTITNVNATGDGKVSVGTNSTLTNAVGWFEVACNDVLFADFRVQYNCAGGLTYFINQSSGDITGYAWDLGDGTTADSENAYNSYSEEGTYEVILTVENGGDVETYSRMVTIGPNSPLNNKVVVNNEQLVSEKPADTYQWFLNGFPVEGATSRIYTPPGSAGGEYFVVTFNGDCNNISDTVTVEVTSTEDEFPAEEEKGLRIYPVPVNNRLFIQWPEAAGEIEIQIMDIQGKTVYISGLIRGEELMEINTGALRPGIYVLKLQNKDKTILRKIIK